MADLNDLFSSRFTPHMKAEADRSYKSYLEEIARSENQNLCALPPNPTAQENHAPSLTNLQDCLDLMGTCKPQFPPLQTLPCANVQVRDYRACERPGTLACAACRLVSYCTKECQHAHWRFHKRDCKNLIKSSDWKPIWILENRLPSFLTEASEEYFHESPTEFSSGYALWGNTPAMDVVNLSCNEKDATKDFSLAFIASGDLRHVVKTINSLPLNYSGRIDLVVNDGTLPVVCRNIVLLLILGTISEEVMAVDIALHFWYSAFIPGEYRNQISLVLISFIRQLAGGVLTIPLGDNSSLSFCLPKEAKDYFAHFISDSISMPAAQDEYDRVRTDPSRRDLRDRLYSGLKPSHRVAFQEYRRFGIILPFGAVNAHFNSPNLSLFTREGRWSQTDYADPLEGWDISAVVETGKIHGARSEDIYGCFYFFISNHLRTFSRRLRQFKISAKIFSFEACGLSKLIRDGELTDYGVPASISFDRIEVSNILDANYVGIRAVLTYWAPLLADTRFAVIIGYFMNWTMLQKDGRPYNKAVFGKLFERFTKRFPGNELANFRKTHGQMESIIYLLVDDINALHENSVSFQKYLEKQGLADSLRTTKLGLRDIHTIVPHVCRDFIL
ncbi:hypothetical protein GALMADRAFT_1354647 [Galerina marginata CBS 339.88]|uniref:MYND-type domain-containing protein n=1 Tax=Galerina marginata (strain CBS 339.88) TaxID=685588 RepID=A0A067SN49_GALM3|nr:hypothetical protein GALMADRAFT_1354647 [Galerina marginata CBS 339.88]